MQEREGLLDDVAALAQVLDVGAALAGDHRQHAAPAQLAPAGAAVVALVARSASGLCRGWPGLPAAGGMSSTGARGWVTPLPLAAVVMTLNGVHFRSQIRWCLLPVFPRSTDDSPVASHPFFARMRESSTQARFQSRASAVCSSASRMRCRFPKTSASCRRPSRRQQGYPNPNPSSSGSSCRMMALQSTYSMRCRHGRSSTGYGPGAFLGQGGYNGSVSAHSSSSTIHGRLLTPHERRNRRTGHTPPAHIHKIVLRALSLAGDLAIRVPVPDAPGYR